MHPIIPYKHIFVHTSLTKEEAKIILSQSLAKDGKIHWFWEKLEGYEGSIFGKWFMFRRMISGRDSFLPSGIGRFIVAQDGTVVEIHILAPAIIFLLPFELFLGSVISRWKLGGDFSVILLILLFMVLPYVFFIFAFEMELPRIEEFIAETFGKHQVQKPKALCD